MTPTWPRRRTLIAGIALIAVTNAVALAGVAWNRSGEPDSVLALSERELGQSYQVRFDKERGGVTLSLRSRALTEDASPPNYAYYVGAPAWLDYAKLASLGFDVSQPSGWPATKRARERQLPREVLIVLEFDGPAYQKALSLARQRAENEVEGEAAATGRKGFEARQSAAEILKREETANSRLFAVDAGLDAAALRAKYADRTRYAIVHGKVRLQYRGERGTDALWEGYIEGIDHLQLNVPEEFRGALGALPETGASHTAADAAARFRVTVAFGKRFEPWIVGATAGSGRQEP